MQTLSLNVSFDTALILSTANALSSHAYLVR